MMRTTPLLLLLVPLLDGADPMATGAKLEYHANAIFGPVALLGAVGEGVVEQWWNLPREWRQGWAAYGRRVGDNAGTTAVRQLSEFGLGAALHQDPRFERSRHSGFWRRGADALAQTVVTRTDGGRRTFAAARVGSAFAATFVEGKAWYPDRLSTTGWCFASGGITLGEDAALNLVREFWPDVRKLFRRRSPGSPPVAPKAPEPSR